MSVWLDALGAFWIALGAYTAGRDSRILALPPYRRRDAGRAERTGRRKAVMGLRWSLFYILIGLTWLTAGYIRAIVTVLGCACFVVIATSDLKALRRSRRRRTSGESPSCS